MVTPTQEEATFWEIDLQRLWTRLAEDRAGSSRMKAIKEYHKERSGCPQEGHLIWGETIIGVGLVDNKTLLPFKTHLWSNENTKELELAKIW